MFYDNFSVLFIFIDQSQILEREQGNNINQDKQSVATNKYPLYEELPRVNDSEKQQKGPFEKDKPERVKVENNDKNVPNQSFHHSDETKKDRKDMENSSPYYHVLESDEKADGQGDISKRKDNEDENTSNETTSPHYFVLEKVCIVLRFNIPIFL